MENNYSAAKTRRTKRITLLAALTGMALIAFMIESLFPPLFVPGAKMGFSNIFTLPAVVLLTPWEAVTLVVVRTVLGSFFAGGISALPYSLAAGLAGVGVSIMLFKLFYGKISLVSISAAAAVVHNITQNAVYCVITQTPELFLFLPHLAVAGVAAGALIGVIVVLALKYLPLKRFAE